MTKNYKPVYWRASISKCPHCQCFCEVNADSTINVNCAITNLYDKMEQHVRKCTSISTMNKTQRIKKIAKVSIMTRSNYSNSTISEWQTDNISL